MSPVRWAPSGDDSAARFSPLKYSCKTSSWSSLERIRSTPDRLKSPLKSSCASGTIMASEGACVACEETVSTWTCALECAAGKSASNLLTKFKGPPQKVNIYIIFRQSKLAYHRELDCETISCLCKCCANFMRQNRDEISTPSNLETQNYSRPPLQVYATRDQAGAVVYPIESDVYTCIIFCPAFPCRKMRQFSG